MKTQNIQGDRHIGQFQKRPDKMAYRYCAELFIMARDDIR